MANGLSLQLKLSNSIFMKRIVCSIVITLLSVIILSAQEADAPIKWQVTVKMNSVNEGTVTFKARIQKGWHLYGMKLPAGGPKSTMIDLSESTGVSFIGDLTPDRAPVKVHDKMFDMDLNWWDADIAIRRKFKLDDAKSAKISGKITYMGCNDQTCSPPEVFNFSKTLPPYKAK